MRRESSEKLKYSCMWGHLEYEKGKIWSKRAFVWKVEKVGNNKLLCSVQGGCSHLYLNDILTFPKTIYYDFNKVLWDFQSNEVDESILIENTGNPMVWHLCSCSWDVFFVSVSVCIFCPLFCE